MARTLTKKQRKFVNEYAEGKPGNLAVVEAGYKVSTDESARAIASQNLTKPKIQEELKVLGFDSNNAKRVVGEILNDETVEPQHRLKASELVFKVGGDFAPDKHLNINLEGDLEDVEQRLATSLIESQKAS